MPDTLFITENYIKTYTPIGQLVQFSEIEPTALIVQQSWTQDILGSNFYYYLLNKFETQTLNPDEIILMNYIKPALAYRVADKTLPFIQFQIRNKGAMVQRGDYSDAVDIDTLRYLREELSGSAEFHEKRLIEWLCVNRNLYPEYRNDNFDYMSPARNSDTRYDSGLSFY